MPCTVSSSRFQQFADHGSSRAPRHVGKRSMQAAKPSEGGGSSQVPPEVVGVGRYRRPILEWLHNILMYLLQWLKPFLEITITTDRPEELLIRQRDDEAMKWVLDSGAWIHHTSNLDLLLDGGFQLQDGIDIKDIVMMSTSGNDDAPHVHFQGHGCVRTECFEFPGVCFVVGDDARRNVVSVSQLARDHGLVTVFEPTSCHVKDKKTGRIVGEGRLCNGMYMLDSLRIVGQYKGDGGGGSGRNRRDGADGGGGGGRDHQAQGNGEGDSMAERRGGGGRYGSRGGGTETGARNQEEASGSGATSGDVDEINEDSDEKEIQEMNENDKDEVKEIGEINDKGEKEEDEQRGGQNVGQFSSPPHTGLFGMSRLACILWIVCIFCIAACILLPYTSWGAGVTILYMDFHSLAGFWVLFILGLQLLKTCMMQSTISKLKQIRSLLRGTSGDGGKSKEKTWGAYLRELPHQECNNQLFGLSRFDSTTDQTGYRCFQLPAEAFPTSTTTRLDEFLVDSGASLHVTWKGFILFHYPQYLWNHTKPPTRSFQGIAGSVAVTRSGYLNGDNIMLDGVLLAPDSRMNLVSVGQLSIQYGVRVEMDDVGVIIKKQDGVQIGGGSMLGNHLYVLEYFQPGGLFAHSATPHPRTFGRFP